jgi:hypothetical protein
MDGDILDAVREWGTRSVSEGIAGLYELADQEFSGAVTDGETWAFVLNGRFVGVFDGDVEDFADAALTAYTAPGLPVPLLCTMQARGGETRGQYYSNETPLTDIDDTLSSGNFVGYVELSENVLSGDYYVVYYGGRSLPVAFVGNSRRLLTGDEAFERAADEVGIYSVVRADVDVIDLPERPTHAADSTAAAVTDEAGAVTDEAGAVTDAGATDGDTDVEFPADTDTEAGSATGDEGEPVDADAAAADAPVDTEEAVGDAEEAAGNVEEAADAADDADATTADASPGWTPPDLAASDDERSAGTAAATASSTDAGTAASDGTASDPPDDVDDEGTGTTDDVEVTAAESDATDGSAGVDAGADTAPDRDTASDASDAAQTHPADVDDDPVAEDATTRTATTGPNTDRSDATSDGEVERLRDRISELEAEIDRLEAAGAGSDEHGAGSDRTLSPEAVRDGTHLFVRYEDKAAGTIGDALEGGLEESALRSNLRLDYHTAFETEGLAVEGQPFESFLRDTTEHRFVAWLLTRVLYELRRTEGRSSLSKLYDAIERIDRIDLAGEVDVVGNESEGERTTTASFDLVFRDKMGDPVFVAALQDSRDPTAAPAIDSLVDGARRVSRSTPSFAAAFLVTTSFFGADAMKAAVDATRGGLFSRSSRESYVKLDRKAGFHLCLVEARDEEFFLTVPEL